MFRFDVGHEIGRGGFEPPAREAEQPRARKRLGADDEQNGEEESEPEIEDRVTHEQAPTVTPTAVPSDLRMG
jgi:hypothetical protein